LLENGFPSRALPGLSEEGCLTAAAVASANISVTESVAVVLEREDLGVVDEPVDQRRPRLERSVCGDPSIFKLCAVALQLRCRALDLHVSPLQLSSLRIAFQPKRSSLLVLSRCPSVRSCGATVSVADGAHIPDHR
jgi:hypothetical protein